MSGDAPVEVRPFPRDAGEATASRLDDGLVLLTLPLAYGPTDSVNCYLLELEDGWCLVDTGSALPPGWEALARALAAAGVEPRDVALLVATHPHEDHYALAAEVLDRTGAELALAPGPLASADVLREPTIARATRLEACRRAGVPEDVLDVAVRHPGDAGGHPRPAPHRLLADGDVVVGRHAAWRVVHAPGHSPAQLVLHDEESGRLISADLVLGGRIPYLEYGYTPDPWREHVEALARVAELDVRLLLPGHGPSADMPAPLVTAARGAAEAAADRLLAVLEEPRTAYDATLAVLGGGASLYRRHAALSGALCVLERLVAEGRAEAVEDDGVCRYVATPRRAGPAP